MNNQNRKFIKCFFFRFRVFLTIFNANHPTLWSLDYMHIIFAHCSLIPCSCQPINFIYRVCECLELQFMNKEFCWSWFNYVSRVVNYNFLQFFFIRFFFPHANEFFSVFLLNWLMHFAWITINCHRSSVSRSFGFKVLTIYFVFLRLFFYQK